MAAINVETPPHYPLVASELAKLRGRIGESLLHRPETVEPPRDLSEVKKDYEEAAQPAFASLVAALQALSDRVLAPGTSPSDAEVRQVMDAVAAPVDRLLGFLHDLWMRPFKPGMEPGRHLLAATVERPLRDILGLFEKLETVISEPAAAVERFGGEVIHFRLELNAEEEFRAFAEWCDSLSIARMHRSRASGCSLLGLAAAFLLGWWWGDE